MLLKPVAAFYALLQMDRINSDQRKQLWNAVEGRFATIIHNSQELIHLLNYGKFSSEQHTRIISELTHIFGAIIQNDSALLNVLNCEYLAEDDRTNILKAMERYLPGLIQNINQLIDVLGCQYLTATQREDILLSREIAIQGANNQLIIFLLYVPENKCAEILKLISSNSFLIINNIHEHIGLFDTCNMSNDQERIWAAQISDNNSGVINDCDTLFALLNYEHFTNQYRTDILTGVRNRLRTLIKNGADLIKLLKCKHLTAEQRLQIWKAVRHQITQLIKKESELLALLYFDFYDVNRSVATYHQIDSQKNIDTSNDEERYQEHECYAIRYDKSVNCDFHIDVLHELHDLFTITIVDGQ